MKIAVVGGGVSGLVAARRLTQQGHDVAVFEAGDRWGGHARSVTLECDGARQPVEVGFLLFNAAACPNLSSLLTEIQAPTREIRVAYEIRHSQSEIVLHGGSLRQLLAVPRNLTNPSFYRLVSDWIRFTRQARRLLQPHRKPPEAMLGAFLSDGGYSSAFAEQFVYPLAGAIFPLDRNALAETPLASMLGLIHNLSLLRLTKSQTCQTLMSGSQDYLQRLTEGFRDRIHLNCPVAAVARNDDYVLIKFSDRPRERYDQVVMAVHADAAYRLLADPTRHERDVLKSFEYATQNAHVHLIDEGEKLPESATWKFQTTGNGQGGVSLSYPVSQVQGIEAPDQLMLTICSANHPPPDQLLQTIRFRRPVFSAKSVTAQHKFAQINGRRRTYFCGSYWGHGFHEDAVRSAETAAKLFEQQNSMQLVAGGAV